MRSFQQHQQQQQKQSLLRLLFRSLDPNASRIQVVSTSTNTAFDVRRQYYTEYSIQQQQHQHQKQYTLKLCEKSNNCYTYRYNCHRNISLFTAVNNSNQLFSDGRINLLQRRYNSNSSAIYNTTSSNTIDKNHRNNNDTDTIRLSKLIATCLGISRKEVERTIQHNEVTITLYGKRITSSTTLISLNDIYQTHNLAAIQYNNKPLPLLQYKHILFPNQNTTTTTANRRKTITETTNATSSQLQQQQDSQLKVWLVHKMAGELVTDTDPFNRPTVMSRISKLGISRQKGGTIQREHLKIVGRLDMNTEGLLIVTNCGNYARQLEYSKHMLHRTYRVRVHHYNRIRQYHINAIQNGTVVVNNIRYPPMKLVLPNLKKLSKRQVKASNQWITIVCTQGMNRQIRKVLQDYCGCIVSRLVRISYGDYTIDNIPTKGMIQELSSHNIIQSYQQHTKRGPLFPNKKFITKDDTNNTTDNEQAHPVQQQLQRGRRLRSNRKLIPTTSIVKTKRDEKVYKSVQWIRMSKSNIK